MIAAWFLIIAFNHGLTRIPMKSEEACKIAASKLEKDFEVGFGDGHEFSCIQTGYK